MLEHTGRVLLYTTGYTLSIVNEDIAEEILNRLDKLTWTGRLTNSTIGLIVPFKIALEEMSYYYKGLTESDLRGILKEANVMILNKPEDLEKYRAARSK